MIQGTILKDPSEWVREGGSQEDRGTQQVAAGAREKPDVTVDAEDRMIWS
jgi:hypothetical protein